MSGAWPGGRRLAVYVAVGVEDYRPDSAHREDLLPGVPSPDRVNAAWREYGNRVGAFRLLRLLEDVGLPVTVLLNTMVYESAPAVTDAARAAGAEIVGHGVSNSDSLADMAPADERRYLAAVADSIERHEGRRPGGWSSPWLAQTPGTLGALAATGYRYLLDLRPDDQPVWLATPGDPLLAVPYALELNDSTTVVGRGAGPGELADMIVDEFDQFLDEADDRPVVMSVVLHSFISGVPFRLRALSGALRHLGSARADVWLSRPGDIYRAFAAMVPPPGLTGS